MVLLAILSWYFLCRSDSFRERAGLWLGYALRIQAYGSGFGQGFVSGNRFGLGHTVRLREFVWTFGKAFPMQECSRRKGNATAVRESGKKESEKDVRGVYPWKEHVRML